MVWAQRMRPKGHVPTLPCGNEINASNLPSACRPFLQLWVRYWIFWCVGVGWIWGGGFGGFSLRPPPVDGSARLRTASCRGIAAATAAAVPLAGDLVGDLVRPRSAAGWQVILGGM